MLQGHRLRDLFRISLSLFPSIKTGGNGIPGASSSSERSTISGASSSSSACAAMASVARALLDLVDILVDVRDRLTLGSSSVLCSAARRFAETDLVAGSIGVFATASRVFLDSQKASTASLSAQFPLNFDSWSAARHTGHFPSVERHRRIHSEQNVWLQDVIMGELKKSLQTWHRKASSTGLRQASGVPSQSVGSGMSVLFFLTALELGNVMSQRVGLGRGSLGISTAYASAFCHSGTARVLGQAWR